MTTRAFHELAGPVTVRLVRTGDGAGGAGAIALVLSRLACYGTLGLIAALSVVGVSLSPDRTLLNSVIVAFAAAATASVIVGIRPHGSPLPLAIAACGAALLTTLMIVGVDRLLELLAFLLLIIAVGLDTHFRARACHAAKERDDG